MQSFVLASGLSIYLYPGVQNFTAVSQETGGNFGKFKSGSFITTTNQTNLYWCGKNPRTYLILDSGHSIQCPTPRFSIRSNDVQEQLLLICPLRKRNQFSDFCFIDGGVFNPRQVWFVDLLKPLLHKTTCRAEVST